MNSEKKEICKNSKKIYKTINKVFSKNKMNWNYKINMIEQNNYRNLMKNSKRQGIQNFKNSSNLTIDYNNLVI